MYKFRTETWGKKVNHELDWTTCYTDNVNGYGHFHKRGDLHSRKQPQGNRSWYRPFVKKMEDPEPYKRPDTDHMWHVLHKYRGGSVVTSGPMAKARLKKMLKDGHKRRMDKQKAKLAAKEDATKPKDVNFSGKYALPPLDPIQEHDPSDLDYESSIDTPPKNSLVTVSMPNLQGPTSQRDIITPKMDNIPRSYVRPDILKKVNTAWQMPASPPPKVRSPSKVKDPQLADPINLPVAGLPTVWNIYKPRRILQNPPPYVPQPAPLPFSDGHTSTQNTPRVNSNVKPIVPITPLTSRSIATSTQTSPPPPLPEIKRAGPENPRLSRQFLPKHLKVTPQEPPPPSRKKELAALLTQGRRDGVDLSWILENPTKWARSKGNVGSSIRAMYRPPGQWKPGPRTVSTK